MYVLSQNYANCGDYIAGFPQGRDGQIDSLIVSPVEHWFQCVQLRCDLAQPFPLHTAHKYIAIHHHFQSDSTVTSS